MNAGPATSLLVETHGQLAENSHRAAVASQSAGPLGDDASQSAGPLSEHVEPFLAGPMTVFIGSMPAGINDIDECDVAAYESWRRSTALPHAASAAQTLVAAIGAAAPPTQSSVWPSPTSKRTNWF